MGSNSSSPISKGGEARIEQEESNTMKQGPAEPNAPRPSNVAPSSYRLVGSSKELHNEKIYCVSWCKDLFEERVSNAAAIPDGNETQSEDPSPGSEEEKATWAHNKDDNEARTRQLRCFATCGGNRVTIYEVEVPTGGRRKHSPGIILRQGYIDPDENETLYTCAFGGRSLGWPFGYSPLSDVNGDKQKDSIILGGRANEKTSGRGQKRPREDESDEQDSEKEAEDSSLPQKLFFQSLIDSESFDGPQMLCVAGTRGIIKVIDPVRKMLYSVLPGHGSDIYDLKFSPVDEWLLLSASKDDSLRLWNVQTATCVAIFAGHEGHRGGVLSVGWHRSGDRFVSGGMDNTIKLWNIGEGSQVSSAIEKSKTVKPTLWDAEVGTSFCTVHEEMPYFSTTKVHTDYVDCVRFVGDLILSKDTHDSIVLWHPDLTKTKNAFGQQRLPCDVIALREFPFKDCDVWFIRFDTDRDCRMVALGNTTGEIRLWDIDSNLKKKHRLDLVQQYCNSTIRMVAFSIDSHFLAAACDDSTVWIWDANA
jgi:polycomb protein EED